MPLPLSAPPVATIMEKRNVVLASLRNQFAMKVGMVQLMRDVADRGTGCVYNRTEDPEIFDAFLRDLANNIAQALGGDE